MSLGAIVLAAGASRRMGQPKALLAVGGTTFLGRAVTTATAAGLAPVRIVVGEDADAIAARHPELAASLVRNPDPELGPLHSLRLGLAALGAGIEGVVVMPVDHPLVQVATIRALAAAYREARRPVVVPTWEGRRGHPTLFGREVFAELAAVPLDAGARAVVRAEPGRVLEVAVDDPGILGNVDTPEQYRALERDDRAD